MILEDDPHELTTTLTLDVRNLHTHFETRAGTLRAVDGVNLRIRRGEIVGLVGESGSGKSVTGFSVIGLVDPPGRIVGGEVRFQGRNLVGLDEEALRRLRGHDIAMIFQDPMMTLNPVLRISTQMVEAITAHEVCSLEEALERAHDALASVGIPHAQERLHDYPHQFSGGMRQRVAIAIALLHNPSLIIADEPTTALDVTIQGQILAVVQRLVEERGTSLLWITHDLSVIAGLADRVAVMYAGRIVEEGPVAAVLDHPMHPYTAGLIASLPSHTRRGSRLAQIQGMAPPAQNRPSGCAFRPRCTRATEECLQDPPAIAPAPGRSLRCFNPMPARGGQGLS